MFLWNKSSHPYTTMLISASQRGHLRKKSTLYSVFIQLSTLCGHCQEMVNVWQRYHRTRSGHVGLQRLEHPIVYAWLHYKGFNSFFSPEFMRQFWLLIFSFPERLDGCAMIWVSKPALSGDQFALRVSLVEELFPPLSCTHPIHQRLQCVLERRFCKERWMINRVGVHSQTCYEDQINITSTITCGPRLNSNTNSLLKWTGVRCLLYSQ